MQLADDTSIDLGNEVVRLRPSLRAAMILHRRYGGFAPMLHALHEGNVSLMADMIRECSDGHRLLLGLLNDGSGQPLGTVIEKLMGPLAAHIAKLAGHDEDAPETKSTGKAVPYEVYFLDLYKIATGWLGWPPEVALSATPAEIIEAQKGRVEMLGAVFGNGKKEDEASIDLTKGRLEPSARDRLNAIGNLTKHRLP